MVGTATNASDGEERPALWLGLAAAMGGIAVAGFWPSYWGGMVVLLANASKYFWQRSDAWSEFSARLADVIRAAVLLPL